MLRNYYARRVFVLRLDDAQATPDRRGVEWDLLGLPAFLFVAWRPTATAVKRPRALISVSPLRAEQTGCSREFGIEWYPCELRGFDGTVLGPLRVVGSSSRSHPFGR